MLPLLVPANASAALVLLPVSASSVVLGVDIPEVEVVVEPELLGAVEPELLEPVIEDGGSAENALEAAPDPQPVSQRLITRIAVAFPNAHKRKSRLPRRRCRRRSHSISSKELHRLTENLTTVRNSSVRAVGGLPAISSTQVTEIASDGRRPALLRTPRELEPHGSFESDHAAELFVAFFEMALIGCRQRSPDE